MADDPVLLRALADYVEHGNHGWEPLTKQKAGRKPLPPEQRKAQPGNPAKAGPGRKSTLRCEVPGCEKPHYGQGWCRNHWYRWSQHGDPLAGRSYTRRKPA